MLPYAKRAHTPEATPLRSGDFEVVRDTRLGAPRAPKAAPVFHRSAPAPLMQAQPAPRPALIGSSLAMRTLREQIERASRTDQAVLVVGESGAVIS